MDDNIKIPPGFKILIIDDDIDFLKALEYTLTEKKINVVAVESGYHALEVFKKDYFDLILLDLRMAGMNGAETFKKIKQIESKPYVVIMTAFSEDEQMKIVNKLKPFGFLQKPFVLDQLMPFIKKRIEKKVNGN
ncbi:MAG: response regulator [Candidatus Aminicenantes bacterium]|nr:MAG: response regulator [Candidatus Aminicenantes bacterium]